MRKSRDHVSFFVPKGHNAGTCVLAIKGIRLDLPQLDRYFKKYTIDLKGESNEKGGVERGVGLNQSFETSMHSIKNEG